MFIDIEYRKYEKKANMFDYHAHDFFEIYYLVSGRRTYYIGNEIYTLEQGSLVIIPPYLLHKTEGDAYERYLITFDEEYLLKKDKSIIEFCKQKDVMVFDKNHYKDIELYFSNINQEFKAKKNHYELFIESELSKLFVYIFRISKDNIKPHFSLHSEKQNSMIMKITYYINNNLDKDLSLQSISKKFFISSAHLSRLFKQITGSTYSSYLTINRLNYAIKLFKTTNKNIEQVSYDCGFSSANYMNYVFRRHLNLSPSFYKTQFKKEPKPPQIDK